MLEAITSFPVSKRADDADPGEQTDLAAANPDVVQQLATAYDHWWDSVQPLLVNEKAPLPAENPFATLYRKQFGEK
jgi:hypothetical protein